MHYTAALTDYFKSPRWAVSSLLAAVCSLIPLVGPVILMGWHIGGSFGRPKGSAAADYPAFDFKNLEQDLKRGLWPALCSLALGAVAAVVLTALGAVAFIGGVAATEGDKTLTALGALGGGLLAAGVFTTMMFVSVVQVHVPLKATLTQDFASAFDMDYVKDFLSKMWPELIVSALFLAASALLLLVVGVLACFVGVYVTTPIVYFSMMHLLKQMHELYLLRGGRVVELSPLLSCQPPSLP
jgi:hypothetical protein